MKILTKNEDDLKSEDNIKDEDDSIWRRHIYEDNLKLQKTDYEDHTRLVLTQP